MNNKNTLAKWSLRIGLAFVFFYASVEIFISPDRFLKYVPYFMKQLMPVQYFLPVFGVSEVLLGFWLLIGWKGQYPSLLSALMMVAIVVCNMEHFQVLFRNVAIGFGALALVLIELSEQGQTRLIDIMRSKAIAKKS